MYAFWADADAPITKPKIQNATVLDKLILHTYRMKEKWSERIFFWVVKRLTIQTSKSPSCR